MGVLLFIESDHKLFQHIDLEFDNFVPRPCCQAHYIGFNQGRTLLGNELEKFSLSQSLFLSCCSDGKTLVLCHSRRMQVLIAAQ